MQILGGIEEMQHREFIKFTRRIETMIAGTFRMFSIRRRLGTVVAPWRILLDICALRVG